MDVSMPFGKYRGKPLSEVPADYLRWCLRSCDIVDDDAWLRQVIEAELHRRIYGTPPPRPDPPPDGSLICKADVERTVRAWYRELAMKFHPDRGGSHEAMVAVTAARDRLCQLLNLRA